MKHNFGPQLGGMEVTGTEVVRTEAAPEEHLVDHDCGRVWAD